MALTQSAKSYIGETLVCAETGKTFIGETDGFTTNYACAGDIVVSDEGVHIREEREIEAHNETFYGYVSNDCKSITGWKGNAHMRIVAHWPVRLTRLSYTHGRTIEHIRAVDNFGRFWTGRGNPGICVKMRPVAR